MDLKEILALRDKYDQPILTEAMLGRGDLWIEIKKEAQGNWQKIQAKFFAIIQRENETRKSESLPLVTSICATGFLESMMKKDGDMTNDEKADMRHAIAC